MIRRPPRSPLFPSPTLFRSGPLPLARGRLAAAEPGTQPPRRAPARARRLHLPRRRLALAAGRRRGLPVLGAGRRRRGLRHVAVQAVIPGARMGVALLIGVVQPLGHLPARRHVRELLIARPRADLLRRRVHVSASGTTSRGSAVAVTLPSPLDSNTVTLVTASATGSCAAAAFSAPPAHGAGPPAAAAALRCTYRTQFPAPTP